MIYPLNLLKLIDFVSLNKFACEMGMFYFMNFIHMGQYLLEMQ